MLTEEQMRLVEAISFRSSQENKNFEYYFADNFLLASFGLSKDMPLSACSHKHDEYEFILPVTAIPYLTLQDAVYFGEIGQVYPVQSGRMHGIKYEINAVSHNDITVSKEYFDAILKDKGLEGFEFNSQIRLSENLGSLIKLFKSEYQNGKNSVCGPDTKHKLNPLAETICAEIIDLASGNSTDRRKEKALYQRGVRSAAEYINENYGKDLSVAKMAEMSGLSLNYFSSCFKNTFGDTPIAYITKLRISKAKMMLETTDMQIKQISVECGFNKFNSFTTAFKNNTGLTPSEYRENFRSI